jgi:hypothetical protein
MGLLRFGCVAIAAFSVWSGLIVRGFADSPHDRSIALAEQGSFFVGWRMVQGKGRSCCGLVAYAANLH